MKKHRKSSGRIGIGEEEIRMYDQIASERHDVSAAKTDRIKHSKHRVISINAEGTHSAQIMAAAAGKRDCQRLQDEYMTETKQLYTPIHPSKTNASKSGSAIRKK